MRSTAAAALLGLGSVAYAQSAPVVTQKSGSISYSFNVPDATTSSSGDILFQIKGPSNLGWIALGQGSGMSGAQIFVIYTSADGKNVTLSPRLGSGHNTPSYNSKAQVTLLEGSGIVGSDMIANVRCSSCASWSGGSMDLTSASSGWIHASHSGPALNDDSPSAGISQHDQSYGTMKVDLSKAKGGSGDANVFSTSTSSSGTSGTSGSGTGCGSKTTDTSSSDDSSASSTSAGPPFGFPFGGSAPTGTGRPYARPFSKRKDIGDDDNSCTDDGGNNSSTGNLNSFSSFNISRREKMITAHAVLACLAFALFFPFGGIAIRLFSFPGVVRFHALFQVFAYITYIVAFGLGINIANQLDYLNKAHPIIGIVLFIALIFQPILGFLHHSNFQKYQTRTAVSYGHLWLGRIAITLGIVNGGLGLQLADEKKGPSVAYAILAAIVWVAYVASILIGERKRARNMPPKYAEAVTSSHSNAPLKCLAPFRLGNSKVSMIASVSKAALCQVFDSIFLDVPMSRVKFNVNTEYAYIQNFKILQNTFTRHHIEKNVPVEALVKCKMQDNLEFLQWSKRYWDQHFPGDEYDAIGRRKAAGGPGAASAPAPRAPSASTGGARRNAPAVAPRTRTPNTGAASAVLQQENNALKETVVGLERERDFYFSKLRDIELLIQQAMEADPTLEADDDSLLKRIQAILYSTEEGFEIPAEGEEGAVEEETF
ncbi:hypothetical protein EJ06DRAFT_541375 [Trichodelitschia bisporula]|uniref:EB1 C-terminal domain-containing protein n=1 Tax=Trichodelitschia bisporula TaxID=703511 RepID=A0A6G1I657_9PEZI|nr:hypothetical protein EJ06DRAFT_541375 [Trichodelitschia bisporula]